MQLCKQTLEYNTSCKLLIVDKTVNGTLQQNFVWLACVSAVSTKYHI